MSDTLEKTIKLGLIGDNITRSKSPRLHRQAGALTGLDVTYDRLIPKDLGMTFEETFARAQQSGFRGINVTYPYKEVAAKMVTISDPGVAAIGAVNTVVFGTEGPKGFNTDYTGFKRAYRGVMGDQPPGIVCLIGTGGVGKAVAYGLLDLGADEIRCVDLDRSKAEGLTEGLRQVAGATRIEVSTDAQASAEGAQGIVNCTPLGMVGIGGTPLPGPAMAGATWAFDAVYTPVETTFLTDAASAGLQVVSGYELFFGQGVDAWDIFTGVALDHAALRRAISEEPK
ncbi:shikimate dehydrogenase [Loktanella sp. IMCC34160]|uniref:shikimate dehydrogenase family protein n=1 Tax=Loktanella sp. IMCC34160 TaxID=2510646 RepID=UPI00101D2AEE|nr:shikimate dehydrogenase [Loktanella sp. IMCC34160]RYG89214.1 shikimate dehydrogenase [Loktanella sp. IMCC34160]